MDEVYRLFDRRCRTETALAKLARLRCRVQRFTTVGKTLQTLFTANVEKALTFLDDRLLAATSNAVERANRRHTCLHRKCRSQDAKDRLSRPDSNPHYQPHRS